MSLKKIVFPLVAMCMACTGAFANPLFRGDGTNSAGQMFLDAHVPDQHPKYTRSEIKKIMGDAKTPEDFHQLASYFDYQSLEFEQKADRQTAELERLLALPFHARSYSTQVETTRELIKSYTIKAKECSDRASAYREQERLADRSETVGSGQSSYSPSQVAK